MVLQSSTPQPGPLHFARAHWPKVAAPRPPKAPSTPLLLSHSQDGEIDLKLLTKVLAPEHEVREVRGCGNACPSAAQGGRLAVTEGMASPMVPCDASLGRTMSAGTGTVCTQRCPQSSSVSGTCCTRTRRTPGDRPHTPELRGSADALLQAVTSAINLKRRKLASSLEFLYGPFCNKNNYFQWATLDHSVGSNCWFLELSLPRLSRTPLERWVRREGGQFPSWLRA